MSSPITVPNVMVEIIYERPQYKCMSIYRMELPYRQTIADLKKLIVHKIKKPSSDQQWYHKGDVLKDGITLQNSGVKENDKILVKILNSSNQ
ncbi:hypothetical protein Btru_077561 [Bulinus truncatus]|nr:hypothetical protein Btru_077561 [Bulinus truncatus]